MKQNLILCVNIYILLESKIINGGVMKTKIILLVFTIILFVTGNTFSQTISITSVSKTQLCVGDEFTVDYVASGTFEDDNVFVVQLSYPNGDFSNFYNIGNNKSMNSGSIICKIPDNLSTNPNYKIRIMSSEPYLVGDVYENDLSVFAKIVPYFEPEKPGYLIGDEVKFKNLSSNASKFTWYFGTDTDISTFEGRNPPPIKYSTQGMKQLVL